MRRIAIFLIGILVAKPEGAVPGVQIVTRLTRRCRCRQRDVNPANCDWFESVKESSK